MKVIEFGYMFRVMRAKGVLDLLREEYRASNQQIRLMESVAALEELTNQLDEPLSTLDKGRWAGVVKVWEQAKR